MLLWNARPAPAAPAAVPAMARQAASPARRAARSARSWPARVRWASCLTLGLLLTACATPPGRQGNADGYPLLANTPTAQERLLNRVTWGATPSSARQIAVMGTAAFLDDQLRPDPHAPLPDAVQAQIDAMTLTRQPVAALAADMEDRQKTLRTLTDDAEKKAAQTAWQQEMNRLQREAAARSLLRDLYSPRQLQEQMTAFWVNHFNVYAGKRDLRVLVGDFEDRAIRPHALGHFRDLLRATARHPAMLRYLDNDQNANRRINENFARELMELHTLGVGGGYTQRDVQELARVLTGLGVRTAGDPPALPPRQRDAYVRDGLFEFNPARHDNGDKVLLGAPLTRKGLAEIDEALDRLSRSPATARHISQRLAMAFVADDPPAALVDAMAATFTRTEGDIGAVMRTLFQSPAFAASLEGPGKFKDPLHYVVSAVRLAYGDRPVLNVAPMQNWLGRLGQPLYGHETPDGYPLTADAWSGSGQMTTRFEIARTVGYSSAGLFRGDAPDASPAPAFPQLANEVYYQAMRDRLAAGTRAALEQATSQQEWNTLLLASPEFMAR